MVQVIDETQADLTILIENDFGPLPAAARFDHALLNWLHYHARVIPRRPRQVVRSANIQTHVGRYPVITKIEQLLRVGGDLSPWLSGSVDTRKTDPCADLMFNDWQISHFHLAQVFATPKKLDGRKTYCIVISHRNKLSCSMLRRTVRGRFGNCSVY